METAAVVFAVGAALLHVYIWVLESFRWTEPATRKTFVTSASAADGDVGTALVLAGTGSMLAAALVLVTHDRSMLRAALVQGTFPALAVLFVLLARA